MRKPSISSAPNPDPRIPTPAFAPRPSSRAPRPSSRAPRRSRSAFTLVELLMVIAIIGMLAALVSVAAVKAMNTGRNAQISTELSMLDGALQTYKNNVGGSYPPDSSVLTGNTAIQDRQNRMLQHLRKAFPRVVVAGGYPNQSNPPPQGTFQYLVQKAFAAHDVSAPSMVPPQPLYGATTPGGYVWGDLNNLDPAEAIVFWVGGLPNPPVKDNTGKYLYSLAGFSDNKVGNAAQSGSTGYPISFGPFSLTDQSRDMGPYEFQQSRLGDADGDGWPEYYPPYGDVPQPPGSAFTVANPMPPYVYFDSTSYGGVSSFSGNTYSYPASAAYPSASGSGIQPSTATFAQGGIAIPYAETVNTTGSGNNQTTTVTWANPKKFQIICAGLDQSYWYFPPTPTNPNPNPYALRIYPAGINYSEGDLDNLTNITSGMLRSAMP